VFKNVDVLAMPTSPTTAFRIGDKIDDPLQMYLNDIFTIPANIAGIPGISIPAGLVDGLPVGLQFMAGTLQEANLFKAAYAYEQATDWHNQSPSI
jgi:aspartyl-tRNA(Asn)/glutamyl-tRNA(Gln) amidotransferase subunit A